MRPRLVFLRILLVAFVVIGVSCGGQKFPSEDDIPEEAFLAYPGAELIDSEFTPGYSDRYIDGDVVNHSTYQLVRYSIEGASQEEIREWYRSELEAAGWGLIGPNESIRVEAREVLIANLETENAGFSYAYAVGFYFLGENGELMDALPGDVPVQFRVSVVVRFLERDS